MVFLYVDVHLFQEHESSTWAHFQAEIPTKVGPELFDNWYSSKIERSVPSEWKLPRLGRPRAMSGPLADMLGPLGMLAGWGWKVTSLSSNLFHALEWYESLFPGGLVIGALVRTSTHCPTNPSKHSRLVESRLRPERHWKVALVCWEPCFEAREDMVYRSDACFSTRPWWLSPSRQDSLVIHNTVLWNSFAKSDDWNVNEWNHRNFWLKYKPYHIILLNLREKASTTKFPRMIGQNVHFSLPKHQPWIHHQIYQINRQI